MAESRIRISKQLQKSTNPGAVVITDSSNEMSFLEAISGSDKLIFYDDSAGAVTWLTVGTNLSITGTTLNASAGAGGYTTIQEEGSDLTSQSKLNFIGGGITAADDGPNSRTNVTLDATLNALAAYNSNGFLVQTSADTFQARSLVAPAAGFTITNNDAVGGNPTFALANDLAALEGLASTGFAVRIGSDSWQQRSIDGTTNRIVVTNGNGVSGNPTIDVGTNVAILNENETVSASWTFSNNITLNGTPSAGTDVTNVTFVNTAIANAVAGLRRGSVRGATTAALTATAQTATTITLGGTTFTHDGVTYANGETILVKDSVSGGGGGTFNNGVYSVGGVGTSVVLTRVTWMDTAAEIDGVYVAVEDGTTNVGTLWITVSEVTTLGTDAITFTRIQTVGTVDGSGATNKVAYWSDPDTLTSTTNFHFNGTQLAVGTASPVASTLVTIQGTTVNGASNFGLYQTNSSGTRRASISDSGVLRLQDDSGDVDVSRSGITASSSFTITQTNTGASSALVLSSSAADFDAIRLTTGTNASTGIHITTDRVVGGKMLTVSPTNNQTATSGSTINTEFLQTYAPTSGTGTATVIKISDTINQTGGANGITRGLHITPTLTAAADYRGLEITANSSHYALWTTAGKVRFDLGSDANWDLLARSATGELTRIGNGTTGQVLTATTGSAPSWAAAATGLTSTIGYIEGSTSSTIDLDANTGVVKDKDGNNISFTVPTDTKKLFVYRNGQKLAESGTITTRDYSVNTTTHVLTLQVALATDEILEVVKLS